MTYIVARLTTLVWRRGLVPAFGNEGHARRFVWGPWNADGLFACGTINLLTGEFFVDLQMLAAMDARKLKVAHKQVGLGRTKTQCRTKREPCPAFQPSADAQSKNLALIQ